MDNTFIGTKFRLADNWFTVLSPSEYNRPIRYLEIGTFHGANLFSVAKSYGAHPDSLLYCIDPWIDYEDYPEYKTQQDNNYNIFMKNLETSGCKDKIQVRRGYSHEEVLKFEDNFFDIIYIDGNHEPEYVLEDAVLSFRKLKSGGIMIFDDYYFEQPNDVKRGVDAFIHGYYKKIQIVPTVVNSQVFVKKLK